MCHPQWSESGTPGREGRQAGLLHTFESVNSKLTKKVLLLTYVQSNHLNVKLPIG